jgi:hypothetical protein
VHSRTCNVWILMCRGCVRSILMMFDMLDCYTLYMCLLLFIYCILYTCFGGSPAREANKIGIFLKKIPYVRRFPNEHKGHVGADVASRICHVAVMFIGGSTNIRPTWH